MKKLTAPQIFWTLAFSLLLLMTLSLALQNQPTHLDDWHPVQVATLTPSLTPTIGWWGPTATHMPIP